MLAPPISKRISCNTGMDAQELMQRFSQDRNAVEMHAFTNSSETLASLGITKHDWKVSVFLKDSLPGLLGGVFNGADCPNTYYSPGYMGSLQDKTRENQFFHSSSVHSCGVTVVGSMWGLAGQEVSLSLKINDIGHGARSRRHFTRTEYSSMWFNPAHIKDKKIKVQAIGITAAHCVITPHPSMSKECEAERGPCYTVRKKLRPQVTDLDDYGGEYYGESTKKPTPVPTTSPTDVCFKPTLERYKHSRVTVQKNISIEESLGSFGIAGIQTGRELGKVLKKSDIHSADDFAILLLTDYKVTGIAGMRPECELQNVLQEETFRFIVNRSPKIGSDSFHRSTFGVKVPLKTFGWGSHGYKGSGPTAFMPVPSGENKDLLQCLNVKPNSEVAASVAPYFTVHSVNAEGEKIANVSGTSQGDSGSPVALHADQNVIAGIVVDGHVAGGKKYTGVLSLQNPSTRVEKILCNAFFRFIWASCTPRVGMPGGPYMFEKCRGKYGDSMNRFADLATQCELLQCVPSRDENFCSDFSAGSNEHDCIKSDRHHETNGYRACTQCGACTVFSHQTNV